MKKKKVKVEFLCQVDGTVESLLITMKSLSKLLDANNEDVGYSLRVLHAEILENNKGIYGEEVN